MWLCPLANVISGPAQDVIEYQLQTFTQGFGDGVTEYWGAPSKEMDQRWAELWHCEWNVLFDSERNMADSLESQRRRSHYAG